ncbi:HAD-IIA family hydrolase [Ileibacterium valens]|uniref:HAD-IIA family hydrolase n=2 Tax=Ileibacterium valens TaxID=1862668 RepID=UPI0024BBCFF2|nr:HAD-IIA family hydrolase [Ileibacterium valens]
MKTLVFDLDGTLYRGTEPIESGVRLVNEAMKKKIPVLFLTNNSMRTPEENVAHMEKMGYHNLLPEQFYNSAMAAAEYVAAHEEGTKAFYIGQNGMKQALLDNGFTITDEKPDFVFVGLDKNADYAAYSKALDMLLNGAKLIGTNKDRILAKPGGFEVGNGSVVALFEYAINQKSPDISKPSPVMMDLFCRHFGLKPEDILLIGDNLETDIALGFNSNVKTLMVESGVHHRQDIERLNIHPDWVIGDLSEVSPEQLTTI